LPPFFISSTAGAATDACQLLKKYFFSRWAKNILTLLVAL